MDVERDVGGDDHVEGPHADVDADAAAPGAEGYLAEVDGQAPGGELVAVAKLGDRLRLPEPVAGAAAERDVGEPGGEHDGNEQEPEHDQAPGRPPPGPRDEPEADHGEAEREHALDADVDRAGVAEDAGAGGDEERDREGEAGHRRAPAAAPGWDRPPSGLRARGGPARRRRRGGRRG